MPTVTIYPTLPYTTDPFGEGVYSVVGADPFLVAGDGQHLIQYCGDWNGATRGTEGGSLDNFTPGIETIPAGTVASCVLTVAWSFPDGYSADATIAGGPDFPTIRHYPVQADIFINSAGTTWFHDAVGAAPNAEFPGVPDTSPTVNYFDIDIDVAQADGLQIFLAALGGDTDAYRSVLWDHIRLDLTWGDAGAGRFKIWDGTQWWMERMEGDPESESHPLKIWTGEAWQIAACMIPAE